MSEENEAVNEEPEVDAPEEQAAEADSAEDEPVSVGDLRTRANERNEFLDMLQRTRAEFSNYRKRVERERGELRGRIIGDFVMNLLPVLDDFDRALAHADESADLESFAQGIKLIENKIYDVLKLSGVEPFEPDCGDGFDPVEHDALIVEETEEYPDQTVCGVHLKGYRMGDRILRPAQVKVAKSMSVEEDLPDEEAEEECDREKEGEKA